MASYTSFLNLEKPTTSERLDVLKINSNWDKIDAGISALNSQKANVSKYPNTNKILSVATDGSSVGFWIQYPSTGAFSVLYADIYGRVAHVYRSSGNASLHMVNGTFNSSSLDASETFLNVGNWVRAQMIITASDGTLDNIQVSTYQS